MADGSLLRPLEELGDLLPLAQLHVGLLPIGTLAHEPPLAFHLAVRDGGPYPLDLRTEQLLDGALDVDLRRTGRHLEHDRPRVLAQQRRLFGHQRPSDYVCQFDGFSALSYPKVSCSFSSASRVAIT